MSVGAISWLQNHLGMDIKGEWSQSVSINVGGVLYATSRQTLRPYAEHPIFGEVFHDRIRRMEDGSFFIDRDGSLFRHVLNYLRSGQLVVAESFDEWDGLLDEARFYQLPKLEELIMDRFEYRRALFRSTQPHAVLVRWYDLSPEEISALHPVEPTATTAGTTTPPTTATSQVLRAPSEEHVQAPPSSSPPHTVTISPPLPDLNVSPDGRCVRFKGKEIQSLEEVILLLLSAYGYVVQHWNETMGCVLLALPEPL